MEVDVQKKTGPIAKEIGDEDANSPKSEIKRKRHASEAPLN
jgi:hypothetical protein